MNKQNENGSQRNLYAEPETPMGRVLHDGAGVCNARELLAALLWLPGSERIANDLLSTYQTLDRVRNASAYELARVRGLGLRSAVRLTAALEAGRRSAFTPTDARPSIKSPTDAAQLLLPLLSGLEQEEFRVMLLTTKNTVLGIPLVYRGTICQVSLRVADVFRAAVRHNAASVIVAHNHPSGSDTVSNDDVFATRSLIQAGKLLEIECVDHIIVAGDGRWVSMKERRLAFE
jgi:DNA repair protein RadC